MTMALDPNPVPAPAADAVLSPGALWNQFILARAVATAVAARAGMGADDGQAVFSYADTHAGPGRIAPGPCLGPVLADREAFVGREYFDALDVGGRDGHPGSWVLAGRVIRAGGLVPDIDVNDLSETVIAQAYRNREGAWTRLWSSDWFLFLRSRLGMAHRPDFVFIDPPADDPRGPAYAIDASILLDALQVPYMVTYPALTPQSCIDQIGRTGLELVLADASFGALLGGGAERAALSLLPDLRRLAGLLGGRLATRLPRNDDYCI